jgi:amino acid transporter
VTAEGTAKPAGGGGHPAKATRARGKGRITSIEGIPAPSLDAISSVAYGPEAMLVVLATAGAGALAKIEPITVAIVVLLAILVFSYRQVIEAYPDGGGCYAVSRANLGARASHLAAASLIVDYVLTVAVSISAGVAALVSAVPLYATTALPSRWASWGS